MRKITLILGSVLAGVVLMVAGTSYAIGLPIYTFGGGTGTTSPSGILSGDNGATNHLNTVIIGSGLTFSGNTLAATGAGTVTAVTGSYPITSSGGTTPNITFSGLATTSPWTSGQVAYVNANNRVTSVATSTLSSGTGVTVSAGAGALVGGSSATVSLTSITGGTVLGSVTTGIPSAIATSTLFGTGTGGKVLAWNNGVPQWVSTTTFSGGLTYSNGNVTNTGVTSIVAGTNVTISGSTGAVTINSTGGGSSTGLATTSPIASSNLLEYSAAGAGSAFGVATTSVSCAGTLSCSSFTGIGTSPITLTGGGDTFGQAFDIDSSKYLAATTTNTYGISTAGQGLTYGYAIGDSLFAYSSTTNADTLVGFGTGGASALTSSTFAALTALGDTALANNSTGLRNTGIGYGADNANTSGSDNVAIGYFALHIGSGQGVTGNIMIGTQTGGSLGQLNGSDYNVAIGHNSAEQLTTGNHNIFLGYTVGTISSGSSNILIGNQVSAGISGSGTGQLNIGNLLYGTSLGTGASASTGNIGVGTSSPYKTLSVGGSLVVGAPTAGGTLGNLFLPGLATPAGTFLAADPNGQVIATSSPAFPYSFTNPVYLNGSTISAIGTCTITVNATAPQSGNNYNTIQAGLNAANVLGGGTVCLTDNSYTITQTIKIGSNITLKGNAYGTVISGDGAVVKTFIQASSTSITNSIIQNLILGNTNILASTTAVAIDLSNMSVTKLDDIEMGNQGFGYGVLFNDTNNQTFYDTIQNLRILNGLNGIYASSTNSVNADWFNNIRVQNTAASSTIGSYCVYINKSQALNFENIDCEPSSSAGHTAVKITSPNAAAIIFTNLYAEGNATGTEVTSSGSNKVSGAISFHGGEITANTVNISDTISNYDNVYIGSGVTFNTNYTPVVITNNLQSANGTAFTVNTGTSFAQSGDLADFVETNASDSGIPLHITNNGTGTSTQISNLGTGPSFEVDDSANDTTPFVIDANGNTGIGTTTPGSLLALGNTTKTTGINFGLATSTFTNVGGINLTTGCFAINNVCISGSGSSGVPSIQQTYGTAQTTAITLATTTDAFNGLNFNETITNSGATFTFANSVSGTLGIGGGGTGLASLSGNQILYTNSAGTALLQTATSSLSIGGNAGTATALQTARTINGVSFNGTANIIVASTTLLGDTNTWSGVTNLFNNTLTVLGHFITVISSAFTPATNGEIGIDTTNNQLKYESSSATQVLSPLGEASFTYATSTTWTGTTTIQLGPAVQAQTWTSVSCYTDTGTLNVQFVNAASNMTMAAVTSSAATTNLTTNNDVSALAKRSVQIGTPASSPTTISCTVAKTIDPT